jgi:hypothetical protein
MVIAFTKRIFASAGFVAIWLSAPVFAETLCTYTVRETKAEITFKDIEGLAQQDFKKQLLSTKSQIECLGYPASEIKCSTTWGGKVYSRIDQDSSGNRRVFIDGFEDKEGNTIKITSEFPPQFVVLSPNFKRNDACGKFPVGRWFKESSNYQDEDDNASYSLNGKRRKLVVGTTTLLLLNDPQDASGGQRGSF